MSNLGLKYGRRAKRIPERIKKAFNVFPNKMLNDQKAEKASAKIELKKKKRLEDEQRKQMLRERYGIC